jgi:hypothetical protein
MTDDNQLTFNLPSVSRKKVTAVFDGGRLSSDSGVMLLALADRRRAVADPQRCGERDRPQGMRRARPATGALEIPSASQLRLSSVSPMWRINGTASLMRYLISFVRSRDDSAG